MREHSCASSSNGAEPTSDTDGEEAESTAGADAPGENGASDDGAAEHELEDHSDWWDADLGADRPDPFSTLLDLRGVEYDPGWPVDNDGLVCRTTSDDVLNVGLRSGLAVPLASRVALATNNLGPRAYNRAKQGLEVPGDWVLATGIEWSLFMRRAALAPLRAELPRLGEYVTISNNPTLAFAKRSRGPLRFRKLMEALSFVAAKTGRPELSHITFILLGDLDPMSGTFLGQPAGVPHSGAALWDFCAGYDATQNTSMRWADVGVRRTLTPDATGGVGWLQWERRPYAARQGMPSMWNNRLVSTFCAMCGAPSGWVTLTYDDRPAVHDVPMNVRLGRRALQGALDATPPEQHPELLRGWARGLPDFWLIPVKAMADGEVTELDALILICAIKKATFYTSWRHELAEFTGNFPPKTLAPLATVVSVLQQQYGQYLEPTQPVDGDVTPEQSFGSMLLDHSHYDRIEFTFDFNMLEGVERPPNADTVAKMARAAAALPTHVWPIDAVRLSSETWVERLSQQLHQLKEVFEHLPHEDRSMSLHAMPLSVQVEVQGRSARLRIAIGDTSARDSHGTTRNCVAVRYVRLWTIQLKDAKLATGLLRLNSCAAVCLRDKIRRRQRLVEKAMSRCLKEQCGLGGKQQFEPECTVERLRDDIRAWNSRHRPKPPLVIRGTKLVLVRRLAEAGVDLKMASAAAAAGIPRGELRGLGAGEKLPCGIRPDLSPAARHQALVVCADKDAGHLSRWVQHRREVRGRCRAGDDEGEEHPEGAEEGVPGGGQEWEGESDVGGGVEDDADAGDNFETSGWEETFGAGPDVEEAVDTD